MQKTQNRWPVISHSITSSALQQLRRQLFSSQRTHRGHALSDPGATPSYRQKPHTWVKKRHRKAHAGFEELSTQGLSETGAGWGFHVTTHGSRNRWGSLHLEKESSCVQGAPGTQNQGERQEPRDLLSRMAAGWPSLKGCSRMDGSNTCRVPEHLPGQQTSSKQHYVKTKHYTSTCPSNDHVAIYSQVKTATTKKSYIFPNQI